MSKNEPRLLDYSPETGLVFPIQYVRSQLYETIKAFEEQRDAFLDMVEAFIKELEDPAGDAVVLMFSVVSGIPLEGKNAVAQDNINRAAALDKKIKYLKLYANNLTIFGQGPDTLIKLTLEQVKEFNL